MVLFDEALNEVMDEMIEGVYNGERKDQGRILRPLFVLFAGINH